MYCSYDIFLFCSVRALFIYFSLLCVQLIEDGMACVGMYEHVFVCVRIFFCRFKCSKSTITHQPSGSTEFSKCCVAILEFITANG